ncbi:hypothetical protein GHT06_013300 [Daphnia sinensis]|uniref:Uncharacterized protein n=1 Tax=Daphnia sinensis TaxID=1820382 RepID=A0AAD5Q0J3_9CRUS|nr:hypothetical protein GHT06_013300 [Daphnia sinensis]
MSLWDSFRARYSTLWANFQMARPERSDYGGECCGLDDSDIVLIALLLLVTALLAYLLLAATVSSGRKKRAVNIHQSDSSTPFTSSEGFRKPYELMVPFACWAELLGVEEELPERCPALCTSVKVKSKEKAGQRKKNVNNTLIVAGKKTRMNKFIAVHTACSLLLIFIAGQAAEHSLNPPTGDDMEEVEEELESEIALKRMLSYVTPLMAIFQQHKKARRTNGLNKRSAKMKLDYEAEDLGTSLFGGLAEEGRKRGSGRRPPMYKSIQQIQPDRSGYGEYSSGSSYGGGGSYGCCDKKDDLLPILALTALSLLLLYLIAIATTTTTAAPAVRVRRPQARSIDDPSDNDIITEENSWSDIELMDAPTWISMVNELWNADEDESSDACVLKALCRMNRLALDSPGSTGLAVSLSSLPLSYLLHHRHQSGFLNYLDASLTGRFGENCTAVFNNCPHLN